MEIWLFVRKLLITVAVIAVAFILQTSVFSNFSIASVVPNIMLIITAIFGLMRGPRVGLFVGFFAGLFLDLYQSSYFGMFVLIYLFLGYFNGLFHTMFFGNDIRLTLLLVGISDVLYGLIVYIVMYPIRGNAYGITYYLQNLIVPEAVYTLIVSLIIYYPMVMINTWLTRSETRSTTIIG